MKKIDLGYAALLLLTLSALMLAQDTRVSSPARTAPTLLSSLPPADAVAQVNVRRLLNEALPGILNNSPEKLAALNREIDQFKARTGIDPRSFDQIALGMRYTYPTTGIAKIETLTLAQGTYSAGAIVAAGHIAGNSKYQELKYQGRTIYIFRMDQQLKLFGLINVKVGDLAVCALDARTLAIGEPGTVRRAIDANRSQRGASPELIDLASQNPNAIMGFGGNITPALVESLKISNDAVAQDLSSVRVVYGALGMTQKDLEIFVAARTISAESAHNLGDTVTGLKQLGALVINRLPAAKAAAAKSAVDNLKITTQGNELQIRTTVAQAYVAAIFGK